MQNATPPADARESDSRNPISAFTATSLVIANMVGTGVFTSLGLQAAQITHPGMILLIWILGGFLALCGALSYAELASALPRSGGEYHFLSVIYHPAIGFVAGWISVIAGFAAPLALAAMAFGKYAILPNISPQTASLGIIMIVTLAHLFRLEFGASFQNTFTVLKLLLVTAFIISGLTPEAAPGVGLLPSPAEIHPTSGSSFAICLIYVMYSYSGWNASVYIAQEISEPERSLPRSLIIGTLVVTILYVGLNTVFLRTTSLGEIAGQIDVGAISAIHIFGPIGGRIVSGLISLSLVSCISAMTWAGPRVWQVMGEDYAAMRFFSPKSSTGVPVRAILVQSLITISLLLTSTFEAVLVYAQFALNLCSFLTVMGVFVLRRSHPGLDRPYLTWGYPFTPLAFLLIVGATMVYLAGTKPLESLAGALTLVIGLLLYIASHRTQVASTHQPAEIDPNK